MIANQVTGPLPYEQNKEQPAKRLPRAGRRAKPRTRTVRWAYYAAVIFIGAIYVVPLLYLANSALKSSPEFLSDPTGVTTSFAFGNFVEAWQTGGFGNFIANSIVYTLVGATIGTLLSVLMAFPIARGYVRWPRFWMAILVLSLFLPNAITAQFQLMLGLGLYDTRLGYLLLMIGTVGVGPLLIMTYLRGIPIELDEAAAMDGCSYFRYVSKFILPLTRPVLITVFTLQAIGIWNDIILATIYLTSPDQQPVTRGLFSFYGQYGNDSTLLAAGTLIVAAPLILLYVVLQKYIVAGAVEGAFKG